MRVLSGIFIFYLTTCANEFSKENRRTTIYTQDISNALKELDFEEFEVALTEFLEVHRRDTASKKQHKSKKLTADGDNAAETDVILLLFGLVLFFTYCCVVA